MSRILPMKDGLANYKIRKEALFDLPAKILIIGKSELSGKSTLVGNLLMRPFDDTDKDGMEFYKGDFKGENIYIVNPSLFLDDKWVNILRAKRIPEGNVYLEFDEDLLTELYSKLERQYKEEVELGKVHQKLIIFDDCAYSGDLKAKNHGILAKMFANGRHIALSTVITSQKYSSINTLCRENATGIILFECSAKQLELIADDHAIQSKKQFEQMFRACTRERHTFMVINYSNPIEARFMDSKFEPIK